MIKVFSYTGSSVQEVSLKNAGGLRSLFWVDLEDPSMKELHEVKEKCNVSISDLKHCLDVNEVPRIRVYRNYMLIITSTICSNKDNLCAPLGIFLSKQFMITIHAGKADVLNDIDMNAQETKELFKMGLDMVVYHLLLGLTNEFSKEMDVLGDEIDDLEEEVIRRYDERVLQRISETKNMILYLRKGLFGNKNVISNVSKDKMFIRNNQIFEDVTIELYQLTDLIELYRERLTLTMEMFLTSASNQVNEVMKSFTVIASLLIIPMLITGLYGMNVVLPLQTHPQAFWFVLMMMAGVVIVMLLMFKWKKWV